MEMTNRETLLDESRRKLAASVPKLAIHIFVAVLIWIFGALVFVPLAESFALFGYDLASIISVIFVVALLIVLLRAAFDIRDTADALAGIVAVGMSRSGSDIGDVRNHQKRFRGILYVVYAVVIFLFFYAFLANIHPVAAGLVLIILVIWPIIVLFQVGGVFSKAFEDWSSRTIRRVGDRIRVAETGVRIEPSPPESREEVSVRPEKRGVR